MTVRVRLDVSKARLKLDQLAGRASGFIPKVSGRLDVLVRRLIKEQFRTQGSFGGTPWQPLSRLYALRKKKAGFGRRGILVRSRRLLESLTEPRHIDQFLRLSQNQYSIGTRVPWAKAMQFGLPERNVPARPIIPDPLPLSWIDQIKKVCESYIVTGR